MEIIKYWKLLISWILRRCWFGRCFKKSDVVHFFLLFLWFFIRHSLLYPLLFLQLFWQYQRNRTIMTNHRKMVKIKVVKLEQCTVTFSFNSNTLSIACSLRVPATPRACLPLEIKSYSLFISSTLAKAVLAVLLTVSRVSFSTSMDETALVKLQCKNLVR